MTTKSEIPEKLNWLQSNFLRCPYRVFTILFCLIIALGFAYATPCEVLQGLRTIIRSPDILVTDYIATAGLGATYVNVGLSGLVTVLIFVLIKHEPIGLTLGTLGLVTGFAFFGKNLINMLPIIFGGYLYSKITKTPYKTCVLPAVLATCLGPAVTQLAFVEQLSTTAGAIIGLCIGIFIGLVINPLAKALKVNYEDYNLYNVGFAAGMLSICIMVILRTMGIDFAPLSIWSEGVNLHLSLFLVGVSLYFLICGLLSRKNASFIEMAYMKADGNDFYTQYSGRSFINMGLMGLLCAIVMLAVNGQYNGPIIGAAISVIGFGAIGKRILSAVPLMAGALLASTVSMLATGTPFNSAGFLVAVLFSTCLSPLCTKFGWRWGVVAGFIHLTFAANVAVFHGGMNLYNNGLAAGLTAMLLLPIIRAIGDIKKAPG
ncbi:MAG: DUF1576 domain-containing protein [Oscillospiraceae bacterium]|nr:DUF1576 domain-containing protein [Oscillospiraceae bacterium]